MEVDPDSSQHGSIVKHRTSTPELSARIVVHSVIRTKLDAKIAQERAELELAQALSELSKADYGEF